jgi:hypothetical protein
VHLHLARLDVLAQDGERLVDGLAEFALHGCGIRAFARGGEGERQQVLRRLGLAAGRQLQLAGPAAVAAATFWVPAAWARVQPRPMAKATEVFKSMRMARTSK